MTFRSITLYNFGVYAGEQTIRPAVPTEQRTRAITLIGGMNGAGKTTLLDAVFLALYGRRAPTVRKSVHSYGVYLERSISRIVSRELGSWVELELDVPGEAFHGSVRVRRSWKIENGRTIDKIQVWRNGEPDSLLSQMWDSYVEDLLPLGLAHLFFFDGEKIGVLAESDETPETVQQALRFMLGLNLVDKLLADLGVVISRNARKVADGKSRSVLAELRHRRRTLTLERDRLNQEIARINVELARTEDLLQRKRDEYISRGGLVLEARRELFKEREKLQEAYVQAQAELINLAAGALPLLLVTPLLSRIRSRICTEQESSRAQTALPLIKERNAKVIDWLRSQRGNEELAAQVERVLADQESQLEQLAKQARLFSMTPIGMGQLNDFLDRLGPELRNMAKCVIDRVEDLEAKLVQIESYLEAQFDDESIDALLKEISHFTELAASLQQQHKQLTQKISLLDFELKRVDTELSEVANHVADIGEAERLTQYAIRSRETMKAFRMQITKDRIATLSERISDAFRQLTCKTALVDRVWINVNNLRITLLDINGHEVPKSCLSSGERQMLALAILWGLAQASGRNLPVIIDTPMARLDSSHRMKFISHYLPNASHQVIVLSTDTEIAGAYLSYLGDAVSCRYLLSYDDKEQRTTVLKGYFDSRMCASKW